MKSAINQFFFRPYSDNKSLAFFRIGLAVILFSQMLSIWSDFLTIYGENGLIRGDVANVYTSPLQITIHHILIPIHDASSSELDAVLAD